MKETKGGFERLVEIMGKLRSEGGCPWDREQTMESLRRYVLEEAYEVVSAINRGDMDELKEELGDLLLQVVFLSRIAEERGFFNISDVIEGICEKLIRRHPHVFGSETAETPEEVLERWKELKAREGKRGNDVNVFPALLRAVKVGKEAASAGYDWERAEDVFAKIQEEVGEMELALRKGGSKEIEEEIGDLLFSVVNFSRKVGADPEVALLAAIHKFESRFKRAMEIIKKRGESPQNLSPSYLDKVWKEVKEDS